MSILATFLAHPIRLSEEEIRALTTEVTAAIQQAIAQTPDAPPGTQAVVVTGRDDFQERIWECGGWDGWARDVATGTCHRNGERTQRYDLIVVAPSPQVGKGTARIVSDALGFGKPVYVFAEGRLAQARSIVMTDPGDAQGGWMVET